MKKSVCKILCCMGCFFMGNAGFIAKAPPLLLGYIQGIANPEDLIRIPNSDWVIASSMAETEQGSGKIYGINIISKEIVLLFSPGSNSRGRGYTLPRFAPHGINIFNTADGHKQLLVINHGSREAVEIFRIGLLNHRPTLNWTGFIAFPDSVWANGLAADHNGNIYATSMYDPRDADFMRKFERQLPTGAVWVWRHKNGWHPLNRVGLSGANGIAVSPDGRHIYVSEWARRRIYRFSAADPADSISAGTDFLPDNIRWDTHGMLLVTGQKASATEVFSHESLPDKPVRFGTVKIDPRTMRQDDLIDGGDSTFAKGTVSIDLGNTYWIGCVDNNKIAVFKK